MMYVEDFVTTRNLFPSLIKAAIVLCNMFCFTITNTTFENSPGYAMIGISVMGEY